MGKPGLKRYKNYSTTKPLFLATLAVFAISMQLKSNSIRHCSHRPQSRHHPFGV